MRHWLQRRKTDSEKGVIIVEATMVLPIFIFAILIILSLVDICYIQSKMSVALNSAAKEMSQYAYLYTTLGLDEKLSGEGGKSSEFMGAFSEMLSKVADKSEMVASEEMTQLLRQGSEVAEGESIAKYLKNGGGTILAKQLVKKNLVSYKTDTADSFLRRNGVVNGVGGLNFLHTSFLTNEDQNEVDVVVTYQVKVLSLLNNDFKFRFLQRATTKVWGKGVSLVSSENGGDASENSQNIWDANQLERGKKIVSAEKKKYQYTSDKNGFHAYDKNKNEFIKICSINTNEESYSDAATGKDAIKNSLNNSFRALYNGVDKVGTSITMKDSAGKDVTINTPTEGRTYKLILVVPDDADMTAVQNAVRAFEQERKELGDTVTVEIRTGYGNSKADAESDEAAES